MPIYRFFAPLLSDSILLDEEESHHLLHVTRLAIGDIVEVMDGQGGLAVGSLAGIEKKKAIISLTQIQREQKIASLHLALPLMRPSLLEWAIEKGTELGVDAFRLFPDERPLSQNGQTRLFSLIKASSKQSGRLFFPSLTFCSSLAEAIDLPLPLYYGDPRAAHYFSPEKKEVLFASGPKEGWCKAALHELEKRGAKASRLSRYTLKAETAPLVAAALHGICLP